MEQLKVGDIGHIYAPEFPEIHLKTCEIVTIQEVIRVKILFTKEIWTIEQRQFVKSELYTNLKLDNNPKPMKPKSKPVAKKATPKQVWRPLGEYEKLYKGDILKQVDRLNYTGLNETAEVKDDTTSGKFNAVNKYGDTGEYQKKYFLTTRPLEFNVQYLRSDGLLFTKDKIGSDDVQHLKNEHKRIGDLLSAHKKYFK